MQKTGSHIVGRNINDSVSLENSLDVSLKWKIDLLYDLITTTLHILLQRNKNLSPHKNLYTNVQSSLFIIASN